MTSAPTALIADDEPLLREALEQQLRRAWPELVVIGHARNGREAIALFDSHHPDICFLDIHMPGVTGIDVAHHIGRRSHIVFVTAFDEYAVQAFTHGALDYLVKPVEISRLTDTVGRLQERLRAAEPARNTEALIAALSAHLQREAGSTPLRWLRASVGATVRLIAVHDIDYLRSDEKYTCVAWRDDSGQAREATVRMTIKELIARLDPEQFAQVHRSVIVNLRAVSYLKRGENETAELFLKGREETLPVSRSYLHLFKQM